MAARGLDLKAAVLIRGLAHAPDLRDGKDRRDHPPPVMLGYEPMAPP